ncbi:MAG TPA: 50S ribosomal protein L11 methyltransferase [Sphingobium sp.]|nr:50S ribosomal protein L11 methyltransferase [Sphingobium sp.]
MTQIENAGAWLLTLPCSRAEAEALDDAVEALFAEMDSPPVLSFAPTDGPDSDTWQLQAYFEAKPPSDLVQRIRSLLPSAGNARPKLEALAPHDWVTLSQAGLPAITAGRFHVRNSEDDPALGGHVNFLIPASRAFGTGQHETTHGCLLMLDRLRGSGHRFGNIADIGTGTGLLAFAALSLWPRAHVIASDIDPAAVEVTAGNLARNDLPLGAGSGAITLAVAAGTDHPEITARAPYDLIVANILAGPLIALAPALCSQIADGGSLVLAGLLDSQSDAVIAAYRRAGMRLAARIDRSEWPTLHLRKRRRAGWRRPARWQGASDSVAPGYGSW